MVSNCLKPGPGVTLGRRIIALACESKGGGWGIDSGLSDPHIKSRLRLNLTAISRN